MTPVLSLSRNICLGSSSQTPRPSIQTQWGFHQNPCLVSREITINVMSVKTIPLLDLRYEIIPMNESSNTLKMLLRPSRCSIAWPSMQKRRLGPNHGRINSTKLGLGLTTVHVVASAIPCVASKSTRGGASWLLNPPLDNFLSILVGSILEGATGAPALLPTANIAARNLVQPSK